MVHPHAQNSTSLVSSLDQIILANILVPASWNRISVFLSYVR